MRIAFVGIGNMGASMAGHLVAAGHEVAVYDVAAWRVDALIARGARAATSPADAAGDAELVEIAVMDDAQVEAVCLGEGGALVGARPGAVVALHSTIHPRTAHLVAAAGTAGIDVLDAPISGGVRGARDGTLCVMVGGDHRAFERARPAFETFADLVVHLGALGAGLAAKLARNLIGYVSLLGAREGTWLAAAAGVDLEVLMAILDQTGAVSPMMRDMLVRRGGDEVYAEDLQPLVDLAAKDMRVILEYAAELGLELPGSVVTSAHIEEAIGARGAER